MELKLWMRRAYKWSFLWYKFFSSWDAWFRVVCPLIFTGRFLPSSPFGQQELCEGFQMSSDSFSSAVSVVVLRLAGCDITWLAATYTFIHIWLRSLIKFRASEWAALSGWDKQAIKTLRALYLFSEKRNLDFVLLILSEKQNLKSKTLFTNSGRCGSFTVVFATCLFGICGSNGFSMQFTSWGSSI